MAHVKAGSSSANQKANVKGKRRGLKVNEGQHVNGGQIIVKQTGVVYHPGLNVKLAHDHSVISKIPGTVTFSYLRRPNGLKTVVNVIPAVTKLEKLEKIQKSVARKKATDEVVVQK